MLENRHERTDSYIYIYIYYLYADAYKYMHTFDEN